MISDTHRLPHATHLVLADGVYQSPDGTLIEGVGLRPDQVVETDWERFQTPDDPLIQMALTL